MLLKIYSKNKISISKIIVKCVPVLLPHLKDKKMWLENMGSILARTLNHKGQY